MRQTIRFLRPNFCRAKVLYVVALLILSAAAQSSPSCSVCGEGQSVGSPDSVILDPITSVNSTCGALQNDGLSGTFNPLQCTILQLYVKDNGGCDCQSTSTDSPTSKPATAPTKAPNKPPTKSPVAPPTEAPVAPPTEPPTTKPTEAPTEVPATSSPTSSPVVTPSPTAGSAAPVSAPPTITAANATASPTVAGTGSPTSMPVPSASPTPQPTQARFRVSGNVTVILNSVSGAMTPDQYNWFTSQTSVFLEGALTDTTTAISSTLLTQELGSAGSDALSPLTTMLEVTGLQFNKTRRVRRLQEDFSGMVASAINADPQGYIEILQASSVGSIQQYFSNIGTVSSSSGPAPSPTPAPAPASSGLSAGAKAGIAIGAIVFAAFVAGGIYYAESKRRSNESRLVPASKVDSSYAEDLRAVPEVRSSAAAVAADLPSKSFKRDESDSLGGRPFESDMESTPSLAITGDSVMGTEDEGGSYAYSLDAGNVTNTGDATSAVTGGASVASASTFSATRRFKRSVVAPAGRLGIVIDTTLEGPVVHTVKPDSPLKGILHVGDIIVMIDDVDTKAMSATSITSLMVKTADQERTLTVLSNR